MDSGLRNAVAITGSPDRGRLAETVALQALARDETDGLYYWRGEGEIDLVARRANSVERLVQVAWTGLDDPKIRRREIGALTPAPAETTCSARSLRRPGGGQR